MFVAGFLFMVGMVAALFVLAYAVEIAVVGVLAVVGIIAFVGLIALVGAASPSQHVSLALLFGGIIAYAVLRGWRKRWDGILAMMNAPTLRQQHAASPSQVRWEQVGNTRTTWSSVRLELKALLREGEAGERWFSEVDSADTLERLFDLDEQFRAVIRKGLQRKGLQHRLKTAA